MDTQVTQYRFVPLIQLAASTGVWGVSLALLLCNGALAYAVARSVENGRPAVSPVAVFGAAFAVLCIWGAASARRVDRDAPTGGATVALIQQNTDPRKTDYREGLEVLIGLTDQAMEYTPDLVAWPETAFVPNIRKWGEMSRYAHSYARLVHDFRHYQRGLETWLVTGNDDYFTKEREDGSEIRLDFNASILFDSEGTRVATYHKIHLVPFTEYFPVRDSFPKLYEWIKKFDVYLWEPGSEPVVFEHPAFAFSTPICFEDSFPRDVRRFVRGGAEVILNLSNDYWSLTEVEAQQHFANSLFRAIENRRPLLRASASGVTCHVSRTGRLIQHLPFYEPGYLVAEVSLGCGRRNLYLVAGDWLPLVCLAICLWAATHVLIRRGRGAVG